MKVMNPHDSQDSNESDATEVFDVPRARAQTSNTNDKDIPPNLSDSDETDIFVEDNENHELYSPEEPYTTPPEDDDGMGMDDAASMAAASKMTHASGRTEPSKTKKARKTKGANPPTSKEIDITKYVAEAKHASASSSGSWQNNPRS